jgi:hypothetical protein
MTLNAILRSLALIGIAAITTGRRSRPEPVGKDSTAVLVTPGPLLRQAQDIIAS